MFAQAMARMGRLWAGRAWQSAGPLLGLLLIGLLLALVKPEFATPENFQLLLRQISFNVVLAVGMTLVILTAGIDLSVGSILGLAGCVLALVMVRSGLAEAQAVPLGILAGLGVGLLCGVLNGLCVTLLELPPFIATLGMMSAARGMALVLTGGYSISGLPNAFKFLGQGFLLWVPVPAFVAGVVALLGWVGLKYTRFGRYIYAIGGSSLAAYLSGVQVKQVQFWVYTLCGLLSALAGVLLVARLGSARPTDGMGYELNAIAAVVIGGTSLMGGQGSVVGSVVGAAIIGVLRNGLVLMKVSDYWQQVIIGGVIIFVVALDTLQKRRSQTTGARPLPPGDGVMAPPSSSVSPFGR